MIFMWVAIVATNMYQEYTLGCIHVSVIQLHPHMHMPEPLDPYETLGFLEKTKEKVIS